MSSTTRIENTSIMDLLAPLASESAHSGFLMRAFSLLVAFSLTMKTCALSF